MALQQDHQQRQRNAAQALPVSSHLAHPTRRTMLGALPAAALLPPGLGHAQTQAPPRLQSWPLNTRSATGIHDIAPAPDGGVWFSAQRSGHLGWFDPRSGKTELIALGGGSSPHGVIAGPDGAAWLTESPVRSSGTMVSE